MSLLAPPWNQLRMTIYHCFLQAYQAYQQYVCFGATVLQLEL
jgi:hypothetical protein